MAFAGLWEGFRWPDGTVARTFTIITTEANATMAELHVKMPVIVEPTDWPTWLGEVGDDPATLLKPARDDALRVGRSVEERWARVVGEDWISLCPGDLHSSSIHRGQNHRPHTLSEISPAVDSPMFVEPDGFVCGVNHGLCRSGHWLESRERQPTEASGIILEIGTVSRGDGSFDLIDHAGGRDWLLCHLRVRLRPPGLWRSPLDGGL